MANKDAKILFFGFSDVGYRCLKYMIDQGMNVIGVFTHDTDPQEECWFKTPESIAKENFIPVFKPKTLKTEKWIRKVRYMKPDLILSLYYRNIIPESIFSAATLGAYNMHGSFLPSYRGRAPLNWSIINGENYCGATMHVLEKNFDTGDIVLQEKYEIGPDEYVGQIQARASDTALSVFKHAVPLLLAGNPPRAPQDSSKASYYGRRRPEDGRIDFNKTAREVFNLVRGVSRPFPGAFADFDGKRAIIWRARIGEESKGTPPGEIACRSPLKIACSDRFIVAEEIEEREIPNQQSI